MSPQMEQRLALAVTSSTGVMSLAVGRISPDPAEAQPLDHIEVANDRRHAEELGPRLRDLLTATDLNIGDLEVLVVDVGPGRFTGLRVGLATVRALAFALELPVIGVTSLETLAAGGQAAAGEAVTAVIDARRQEVFQQVFVDGESVGPAKVGTPEELSVEAAGIVLGDGLDRYREIYQAAEQASELRPVAGRNPRAIDLLPVASGRTAVPGREIVPVYLREPDAVANIRTRTAQSADSAESVIER